MKRLVACLSLALALLAVSSVLAQTGGSYDLSWSTLDGGGYTFSTGGTYSLGGTIGQPEAGEMNGGVYALSGGFWTRSATAPLTAIVVNSTDQEVPFVTDGNCTLGEAIAAANMHTPVDGCAAGVAGLNTIIVPAGIYTLTQVDNGSGLDANGLPQITSTLIIQGAGADHTIIARPFGIPDGHPAFRFFYISTPSFTLNDVTVRGGSADIGGAIFIYGGMITLTNDVFSDNSALHGGVVADRPGFGGLYATVIMSHSTFLRNQASGQGGVLNGAVMKAYQSTFVSNTAQHEGGVVNVCGGDNYEIAGSVFYSNTGSSGGVIDNHVCYSSPTRMAISDSVFHDNVASLDGGVIRNNGRLTITLSQFYHNHSGNDGGALQSVCGTLDIDRSAFYSNSAASGQTGGAIKADCLTLSNSALYSNTVPGGNGGALNISRGTITNTTIAYNAAMRGGGVAIEGGNSEVDLNNVTIAGNTDGGGIFVAANGGLTQTIENSILAGNVWGAPTDCLLDQFSGPRNIISRGHNLIGLMCDHYVAATGDLTGTIGSPLDPMLGPLQDNGGSTWTRALLTGSPAIDAGNNATCTPTDQRGVPRPQDGNGDHVAICDMGAYEGVTAHYNVYLPLVRR